MRLLLAATAAMLIYELGSALLSVASQVQGQEDAQRTGVRCEASACSVQKLASQTASCKVLPGHCSTPVPKQLLSRLSPHIARDKTDVPPQPQSQAFLLQRRLAKRPHPLPRILQGFTRRWLREGVCWTKVTKPAGQNWDSNPGARGSCQSRAEWGTDFHRPPVGPRPHPGPWSPSHTSLHSSLRSLPSARNCHGPRCCCCHF